MLMQPFLVHYKLLLRTIILLHFSELRIGFDFILSNEYVGSPSQDSTHLYL